MKLQPIVRNSLVDTAVEHIRDYIERERLQPEERLPSELEFTRSLGVSRAVLREATSRLESMGLLTIQRGRGMFVGDGNSVNNCAQLVRSAMALSPKEWLSFAEFRAAIECQAARNAAQLATPEDIAALGAVLAQMSRTDITPLEYYEADLEFHVKILQIARNELLNNVFGVLQQFVLMGMVGADTEKHHPVHREYSLRFHQDLFAALKSGDPDVAEKSMRAHMNDLLRAFKKAEAVGKTEVTSISQ